MSGTCDTGLLNKWRGKSCIGRLYILGAARLTLPLRPTKSMDSTAQKCKER